MNETVKELLKRGCRTNFDLLIQARNRAIENLESIVEKAGGFIATLPCDEKSHILATVDYNGEVEYVLVYGIRYVKGEGLYLCTRDQVDNYEYDKGYCFEYTYNFEGQDLEEANKMLSDLAYFVSIDDESIVKSTTVISILGSLDQYI